jgi:hypothetical protein
MPRRTVPGLGKIMTFNMRCTPSLREKIAQACASSGRSISAEISHRVEQTFMDEEFRRQNKVDRHPVTWLEGGPQ